MRATSDADRFVRHMASVFDLDPEIEVIEPTTPGQAPVGCLFFPATPEPGHLTMVTYGLSAASHPDWKLGKPELLISLETGDRAWGLAVGTLVERYRSKWSFLYGQTMRFGQRISAESDMSAFFVYVPAILDQSAYLDIELGSTKVNIAGVYPMYEAEVRLLRSIGVRRFWELPGLDIYAVKRRNLADDLRNWEGAKPDA